MISELLLQKQCEEIFGGGGGGVETQRQDIRPISYSCYHRYNNSSYLSIYTALVKRNHSVTGSMVERLRNWP